MKREDSDKLKKDLIQQITDSQNKVSGERNSDMHGIGLCINASAAVLGGSSPMDKKSLEENIKKAEDELKTLTSKTEKDKNKLKKQRTFTSLNLNKNRNMLKAEVIRNKTIERATGAIARRLVVLKKKVELAEKMSKVTNPDATRFVSDKFKDLNEECKATITKK